MELFESPRMIRQIHSYSLMSDTSTIFYPSLKNGPLMRPAGHRRDRHPRKADSRLAISSRNQSLTSGPHAGDL